MKIVTGRTGTPHVSSADARELNAAIFGSGQYVLDLFDCLRYDLVSSNTIRIKSGALIMQGCQCKISSGSYDELTIASGAGGYNRADLIVASYLNESGIESVELKVIQGQATTGEPTDPEYVQGDILAGATAADMPLYRINLAGINVESVEPLFQVVSASLSESDHVGEVYDSGSVAYTAATGVTVYGAAITLEPGVYVIHGLITTTNDTYNATTRQIRLHVNNGDSLKWIMGDAYRSYIRTSGIFTITEEQEVSVGFYQSSGATVTGSSQIRAVRIK